MANKKLTKIHSKYFNPPISGGLLVFRFEKSNDLVKLPFAQILYFSYSEKKDLLSITYGAGNTAISFKRDTYGFEDCHAVVMDMYARAQYGENASYEDYNADGKRKDGHPLIEDIPKASNIKKPNKNRTVMP
jgi:hypothetical protein